MRKLIYFVSTLFILSCSNNDDFDLLSSRLALKEIVIENNKIKLEWNRPYINNFSRYVIYKSDIPNVDYTHYYNNVIEIYDIDETIYFDNLSLDKDVYYTVVAFSQNGEPLVSNSQKLLRDDLIIFNDKPSDAILYPENNALFIFIDRKIYLVDYENMEVADSIVLNSNENFGSIGSYNGSDELYIACSDGFARIYDINTLNEVNNIYVGGKVKSVITDSYNNLYIKTYKNYDGDLHCYSRVTLNLIDSYTDYYNYDGKIKHLNNSNRIISRFNDRYVFYYDHDLNGNFTNSGYIYNSNISYNDNIIEIIEGSEDIIVGATGVILNSNLEYITQIGDNYNNTFSSFSGEDYIYASNFNNKEISLFNKVSYYLVKNYSTNLYPLNVFKDNNTMIIIGTDKMDYQYYSNAKFSIEKITIN